MPKKKWTSRRITRDIIILLVVLSAAVIAPVSYLASQARKDISEQFIQNAANQAVAQFRNMSSPIETTLGLVRDLGASEAFSMARNEDLKRVLFPIFVREPKLSGISVADVEGSSLFAQAVEDGFRSRRIDGTKKIRTADVTMWNSVFEPTGSYTTNALFDPLKRPWFAPALIKSEICWTDPYKFFTSGDIGITASTSYHRKKDNKQVVLAFDVLLDDLFLEMHKLIPSDNSRIFIFRRDAKLYMPDAEGFQSEFLSMGDVGDELVRKAHSRWIADDQFAGGVVLIQHQGALWWCGFQPLEKNRRTTWICVMVPEADTLVHAGQRSKRLWLIGISSILAATGLAFWMIRRYGRPNESTATFEREDAEGSVRRIIAGGENRYVEFKSTMRMNLHSKKPGKEIEMAWVKGVAGFLNTDGGILLLGVTDDGEITGLERDVFENEDKCRLHFKNLISKHIGADRSKYIRFIVVPMDGKTVGVVRCDRSSEPVFMKDGNKEHFYIRNGPSSDELPVSQALNYIKHRE